MYPTFSRHSNKSALYERRRHTFQRPICGALYLVADRPGAADGALGGSLAGGAAASKAGAGEATASVMPGLAVPTSFTRGTGDGVVPHSYVADEMVT